MKRIALLAAAALASGCVVEDPFGDVAVYWSFLRHTDTGGVTYGCAQAGVDYVLVTDTYGYPIDPLADDYSPSIPGAVPCVFFGVEGASYLQFATGQSYTFVVHAYRDLVGADLEVFSGQGTVTVGGGRLNPLYVTAPGIQGDLDVFLYEGATLFSCLGGDTLGYTLADGIGTTVDQFSGLTCGNPIAFTGVDLDNLDIRVQVTNNSVVVLDSCVSQPFNHFGNDIAGNGWAVALQTAPCP